MVESVVQSHAEIVVDSTEKSKIRVLHVDDELGLLRVAKHCLELQGPFHVDTAGSVEEALAELEKGRYDAVVSDYQMPGKDGLEFLETLRKNGNTIPFIMFTGKGREEVAVKAWSLGADHYVNKTGDPETVYCELAHCLRSTVEKHFAEAQMKETVQKLQTIYQNAVEGITYVDPEENIVYANKAFADIIGYEQEQLAGMNLREIVDDENWAKIESETERRRQGESSRYEAEFRRRDGTVRNALISGAPLLDHDGRFAGTIGIVSDITERKEAEEKLRLSEEKYKGLFENSRDVIVLFDLKGNVTSINKAAEEYGFNKSGMLGKSMLKFVSKKHWPKLLSDVAQIALGKTAKGKIDIHTPKGDKIAEYRGNPIFSDNRVVGVQAILEDVTEREVMEKTIRESEEKWRSLVDMAPDGILTADLKGVITSANNAFLKLTGYTHEEIVGKHFTKLHTIPAKDIPRYAKLMIPALGGKLPPPFEYSYKRKDGRIGWAEARIGVLTKDGKTIGFQAFLRETTERRQSEQAMRKAKEFSESLIDSMQDGLSVVDIHGVHTSVNPALCKITGFSKEELLGVGPPHPYWPPEARKDIEKAFQKTLHEEFGDFELTFMRKNGERFPVIVTPSAIEDEHGNLIGYFATIKDVTFLKEAGKVLKRHEAELSAIIENTGDSVWSIDNKGHLLFANAAFKRQFSLTYGIELKEGMNLKEAVPTSQVPFWLETHNLALKGGHFSLEHKLEIKGVPVEVEISVNPIINENGETVGATYFSRDITERKKAEETLRKSEEKYRQLVENLHEGIWAIDKDAYTTFVNSRMADMLGYTIDEMKGKHLFSFMDERGTELAKNLLKRRQQGIKEQHDFEFIRKDGMRIYATLETTPLSDENGNYIGALASVMDTTERRKMENALRESEEKHRVISGITADFLFSCVKADEEGFAIDWMAGATEEIFGCSAKEIEGKGCWKFLVHPQDLPTFEEKVTGLKPGQSSVCELRINHKDGSTRWIKASSRVVEDGSNPKNHRLFGACEDITERKKAEESVRAREERYRSYIEVTGQLGWTTNANGEVEEDIPAWRKYTGQSYEEAKGWGWTKALHPDDLEHTAQAWEKAVAKESSYEVEYRMRRYDGVYRYFIARGVPVLEKDGKIREWVGTCIDITERKKAEEALKDSEEKFRNLAEKSPNMIFINQKGRVVYANRKAEDSMGYTREEFCSPDFNFLDLIAEESKESVKSAFSKHTRGDDAAPHEYKLITKEGRTIDAIINSKLIKYDGEPAILGVATDITDRKKAERMTLASQQSFKALFMGNPEAAAHLAPDFHILDVDPRFEELFGYSLAEAKGRHINDVIVPETKMEEAETLDKNAIEGYVYHNTVRKRKDGSLVPVALSAATIMVEGKPAGCIAMYKDISELKNAEKKLETMNEKLQVVGGLTRHDVRNKLSAITGNIYLNKKKSAGNPDVLRSYEDMESACEQIVRIFDFAKDYEMLGVEELSYADVEDVVQKAVSLFSNLNGVKVVNECHGSTVLADSLLRQLFYNLIDNSLKYGKKLSQIRIHYEKAEGNQLRLIYEDDGVGIALDAKPKIFDEGYTTGKGSGYGLYLVKRMMEVYGWTIQETGTPGKGARFTMVIPEKNQNGKENYQLH